MFSFIRTTVAGGLLFILPLMLIVILMEKAVHLLREPIRKLLAMFTHYSFAGITLFKRPLPCGPSGNMSPPNGRLNRRLCGYRCKSALCSVGGLRWKRQPENCWVFPQPA